MKLPEISIIIPVYEVEPYINACLSSVISQTYKGPLECILVDDCGQDNSISIAESIIYDYTGNIKFTIIHHDTNRGLSVARNTGLQHASGKYVFFLDSDDEITPQCIELLSGEIIDRECDIVVGDFEIIGNRKYSGLGKGQNTVLIGQRECLPMFLNGDIYVMAWNKLISRNFLIDNDLWFKEGLIYEDMLWTFYMAFHLSSVVLVREITYRYKIRPNSITSSVNNDKFRHRLSIFNEKNEIINSKQLYSKFRGLRGMMLLDMSSLIQLNLFMKFPLSNVELIRRSIKLKHIICANVKFKSWVFAVALRLAPLSIIPYIYKIKTFVQSRRCIKSY